MTLVKANLEDLRSTASTLGEVATCVEDRHDALRNKAASLVLSSTFPLEILTVYVEGMRKRARFLRLKADWLEIVNTGDDGNVPTGDVSYEVLLDDTADLASMEVWLGEAIAELGGKLATSDYKEGDPRLDSLHRYMKQWENNGTVMAAVYSNLGPEGTLALTDAIGKHVGLTSGASQEESETAQTLLREIKRGLVLASHQWSSSEAEEFGQNLVQAARYMDSSSEYYEPGVTRLEALTWLMYNNAGSESFVLGAAEKMHEIQQQDVANGAPWWSWSWTGPSQYLPAVIDLDSSPWALDLPSVILHDLGSHPIAAYKFFADDHGRLTYWAGDYDYSRAGPPADYSGIASALDAACTEPRNIKEHPQEAAEIASIGLNTLASRSGFGESSGGGSILGVETAGSLGHILSTYVAGLNESIHLEWTVAGVDPKGSVVNVSIPGTSGEPQFPSQPLFDTESVLPRVLNIVGQRGRPFLDLRAAQNAYQGRVLPDAVNAGTFTDTAERLAETEGYIASAIGTGKIDKAAAEDDYAKAWIDLVDVPATKLAQLASAFAPPGTSGAANWASDKMVSTLSDYATRTWASNTDRAVSDANKQSKESRLEFVRALMFSADEQGLLGYQHDHGELNPDSPAVRKKPDGTYRLITRDEYSEMVEAASKDSSGEAQHKLDQANTDLRGLMTTDEGYGYMSDSKADGGLGGTKPTEDDLESAYNNMFSKYHDKKDG